jgi:hypothetical protein
MDHIKFSMVAPAFPYYPVLGCRGAQIFRQVRYPERDRDHRSDRQSNHVAGRGERPDRHGDARGHYWKCRPRRQITADSRQRQPDAALTDRLEVHKGDRGPQGQEGRNVLTEGGHCDPGPADAGGPCLGYPVDYEFAIDPRVLFTVAFKDNSAAVVFAEEIKQSLDNNTDVSAVTFP